MATKSGGLTGHPALTETALPEMAPAEIALAEKDRVGRVRSGGSDQMSALP